MKTEDLIRELENVEKKYKGRQHNTFEVCIDQMAHDCAQGLKALAAENAALRAELELSRTEGTKGFMQTIEQLQAERDTEKKRADAAVVDMTPKCEI